MARRFYLQALLIDSSRGLPFNQIAFMAGTEGHGLKAAFYYLRRSDNKLTLNDIFPRPKPFLFSLNCKFPFEGSETNLQKLLERNEREYQKFLPKDENDGEKESHMTLLPVLAHGQERKRAAVFLLQMVNVMVNGKEKDKARKTLHLSKV